jgi:uncharacterized membrane protein
MLTLVAGKKKKKKEKKKKRKKKKEKIKKKNENQKKRQKKKASGYWVRCGLQMVHAMLGLPVYIVVILTLAYDPY